MKKIAKLKSIGKSVCLVAILGLLLIQSGCKKDANSAQIYVKIDYLGSGGYYNDDIPGVPSNLVVGVNGPFPATSGQTYHLEYKADANYPVVTEDWNLRASGPWTIHCYVSGNAAYITGLPGH